MPFAVALLCHPAGAYTCLVVALAAFVYAWHTRRFVPAFTAASAALLTTLSFLHVPPDSSALLLLAIGVVLLQVEFLRPTYGAALLIGLAASIVGSWQLLAARARRVRHARAGTPRRPRRHRNTDVSRRGAARSAAAHVRVLTHAT